MLPGEVPSPLNPAVRLPLPSALPARDAALRPAGAGADTDARTLRRVPPVR